MKYVMIYVDSSNFSLAYKYKKIKSLIRLLNLKSIENL